MKLTYKFIRYDDVYNSNIRQHYIHHKKTAIIYYKIIKVMNLYIV